MSAGEQARRIDHTWIDGCELPDEHKAVWHWLIDQQQPEPREARRFPMKRPARPAAPTRFGVLVSEWFEPAEGEPPELLAAHYCDEGDEWSVDAAALPNGGQRLLDLLLTKRNRSRLIVLQDGSRFLAGLAALANEYLVPLGYTLQPLSSRGNFNAVVIRKHKCLWTLAGDSSVFGSVVAEKLSMSRGSRSTRHSPSETPARALYQQASELCVLLQTRLGTTLKTTLGQSAATALKQSLPEGVEKWHCSPLLTAMLREGGGYRGGITYARPFEGEAEKADISLAYTSALSAELPVNSELGEYDDGTAEYAGVYVCSISDAPCFDLSLPQWDADSGRVAVAPIRGAGGTAVLLTAELEGLRALGVTVTPRLGYRWKRTITLGDLETRIVGVCEEYGRGSVPGKLAKAIGNAACGKLGEQPGRESWLISAEHPGNDWLPAVDETGEPVLSCWAREETSYRTHQHADMAAVLTATVRNVVMLGVRDVLDSGERIYHIVIDSIVASGGLEESLACVNWQPGSWRYEGYCDRAIVVAVGRYEFQGKQRVAGVHNPPPDAIQRLARGAPVVTAPYPARERWAAGPPSLRLGRPIRRRVG